jgi:hypothetical protein
MAEARQLPDIFSCSLTVAYRRCPDEHLLQFALPCGERQTFSKKVIKNDDFTRAKKMRFKGLF